MSDIVHLLRDVFPWISHQATCLGLETQDNRFAQLGGELFILSQQIHVSSQADVNLKLLKLARLINKACSVPGTKYVEEKRSFDALWKISEYKDSKGLVNKGLIRDIRRSLLYFVLKNPEYRSLVHLITDCQHATDLPDALPDEDMRVYDEDLKYAAQANNILYNQLRLHSACSCSTKHLELARLRLDAEHGKQDEADITFDMVFAAGPTSYLKSNCHSQWKEAKVLVAIRTRPSWKKHVSFEVQSSSPSPRERGKLPLKTGFRRLEIGDFCRLIGSEKSKTIHFHIQNNVMGLADPVQGAIERDFLPHASTPLSEWLEQITYLSNRTKVTLAYTIARSVWRYYNSHWMAKPWTHENIQIMKERINIRNHIQPHLYFTTKLYKCKEKMPDYCIADDLFHMYPAILALGVVLVEIAAEEPFRPENTHYVWDETTINDYYEWAWTTANGSNLGGTIGAGYQAVVDNCLNSELFRDGPIESSKSDEDLETRQSLLYQKVVLPLRELYDAYKNDWDVQEMPRLEIPISPSKAPQSENIYRSRLAKRSKFTIAIFCALPLEADAVIAVFNETRGEEGGNYGTADGDDNTYTLGKILHHNVVLVHMAGMGKGAAAQAASNIRFSFPEIKLALVVGICGGVPSLLDGKNDIILGDVVISDGIVQYDYGRQFPDTFLSKTGPEVVARPSPKIRGLLAKLKGEQGRERIERKLSQNLMLLQGELGPKMAGYPGTDKDELFQSAYRHKHQDPAACRICTNCKGGMDPVCEEARLLTCQQLGCQKGSLVPRKRLQEASTKGQPPRPKIHFGLVGSGDTIMKSGQHRDETATCHNLIAYEMEASGVWDNLPCLVIKGVCDYADSHKNKDWQHYAAATAAACMKAVLEIW